MPVIMSVQKKPLKQKQLKARLAKELTFLKNVFSVLTLPSQMKDGNEDDMNFEMVSSKQNSETKELPQRARSIAELEEKLEKIKSQNKFNLKNKLVKKSLSSKLNKKIKKGERRNKTGVKPSGDTVIKKEHKLEKIKVKEAKPIFNTDGKLVFSKFDFSNVGHNDKPHKTVKNPKKILENLKHQEEKFRELEENEQENKVKEIKEKNAWKTILQKAEGQKIKDDPILLKKSIKRMEQKKKQSKTLWENQAKNVTQKKESRQKKRSENISKKKKEKKSKKLKAVSKRRVVI